MHQLALCLITVAFFPCSYSSKWESLRKDDLSFIFPEQGTFDTLKLVFLRLKLGKALRATLSHVRVPGSSSGYPVVLIQFPAVTG